MSSGLGHLRKAIEQRAEKGRDKGRHEDRETVYPMGLKGDEAEQHARYESQTGSPILGIDFQWNAGQWGQP